jgi:hypothetical protein
MMVVAPCPGERPCYATRTPLSGKLEQRVRKRVVPTTYGYDAFGQRVIQTGTTTTTLYPFKWFSIASSTGTGAKYATTTSYMFNGDTLLALASSA